MQVTVSDASGEFLFKIPERGGWEGEESAK